MNYSQPWHTGIPSHPYPGPAVLPGPASQHGGSGFCQSCCHPRSKCCCGHRECRKEAKELLVEADTSFDQKTDTGSVAGARVRVMASLATLDAAEEAETKTKDGETRLSTGSLLSAVNARLKVGTGKAFIGGGCCVHLSIEYTPINAASTTPGLVGVVVQDSEKTILAWVKQVDPQDGYQIKECIITTKPGAHVVVAVVNATARLRWCEVFSC